MSDLLGAIEIQTSFFPLDLNLLLCTPRVAIDGGDPPAQGWATRLYRVPAGRHHVRAWCPSIVNKRRGESAIEVDVAPGYVTGIRWKAALYFNFLPGSWSVLGARPFSPQDAAMAIPVAPAGPPPGWYPDPQGRAAFRWWDGRWTDFTSDD